MKIIGLTGGMGMGKSTAADVFRRAAIPVFDADAEVRAMQAPHGRALPAIEAAFPGTVRDGVLDRGALRSVVAGNPPARKVLERIIHPMVHKAEHDFLARARRAGNRLALLDIPLLLETNRAGRVHLVVVVSAPKSVQVARVRRRGSMTPAQIEAFIAAQMPDAEKRRRADVVIRTGLSRYQTQRQLRRLILELRQ